MSTESETNTEKHRFFPENMKPTRIYTTPQTKGEGTNTKEKKNTGISVHFQKLETRLGGNTSRNSGGQCCL
jgi:hypothetical protein